MNGSPDERGVFELALSPSLRGTILDVGGGGECVIGRLYGRRVIAIDNCREELEDAPDCCEKRLMDARSLAFPADSFDNVTFFYALMYMSREVQGLALREASRVLRDGGTLCIWDVDIPSAWPEPFVARLRIRLADGELRADYGILKDEAQDMAQIDRMAIDCGLVPMARSRRGGHFYLEYRGRAAGT